MNNGASGRIVGIIPACQEVFETMSLPIRVVWLLVGLMALGFCLLQLRRRRLPNLEGAAVADRSISLLLNCMLAAFAVTALDIAACGDASETVVGSAVNFLSRNAWADSWGFMAKAIDHLRSHPGQPLYQTLFFDQHVKFIYPLSSLTWLDLLQTRLGWTWPMMITLVNKLCWLIPLAMIPICVALVLHQSERSGSIASSQRLAYLCALAMVCGAVTLTFYPVLLSFQAGQIQTVITLLVALALLAWQRQAPVAAGLLLGICCSIKPQWLVLLPWALMHRQHRMAIALLMSAAVPAVFAQLRYGGDSLGGYLSVLRYLGEHGEAYYANQSINGLMNRLLSTASSLTFEEHGYPPYNLWVHLTSLACFILLIGWAVLRGRHRRPNVLDLSIVILSLTLSSPIAWEHHYAVLLPILMLATPAACRLQPFGRHTDSYLVLAYVLVADCLFGVTKQIVWAPATPLQSTVLVGAVMILYLLARLSEGQDSDAPIVAAVPRTMTNPPAAMPSAA